MVSHGYIFTRLVQSAGTAELRNLGTVFYSNNEVGGGGVYDSTGCVKNMNISNKFFCFLLNTNSNFQNNCFSNNSYSVVPQLYTSAVNGYSYSVTISQY